MTKQRRRKLRRNYPSNTVATWSVSCYFHVIILSMSSSFQAVIACFSSVTRCQEASLLSEKKSVWFSHLPQWCSLHCGGRADSNVSWAAFVRHLLNQWHYMSPSLLLTRTDDRVQKFWDFLHIKKKKKTNCRYTRGEGLSSLTLRCCKSKILQHRLLNYTIFCGNSRNGCLLRHYLWFCRLQLFCAEKTFTWCQGSALS